jgi:hypothetical protein
MLKQVNQLRRKMPWLALTLAFVLACAPLLAASSMAMASAGKMASAASMPVPCPQHMGSAGFDARDSIPDPGQQESAGYCYCGLYCHAVLAMAPGAMQLVKPGRAPLYRSEGDRADGSWPLPLPRPPRN